MSRKWENRKGADSQEVEGEKAPASEQESGHKREHASEHATEHEG